MQKYSIQYVHVVRTTILPSIEICTSEASHALQYYQLILLQPNIRRFCPSCNGCIEDEKHAIFHCDDYYGLRARFSDLFASAHSLRSFLVCNPSHRVALYLTACRAVRLQRPASNELTHMRHDDDADVDIGIHLELGPLDTYDSSDDESS